MDAIGEFLKVALYRVIFVLIVGIPAVEVFSFAFFGNGIVIQKLESNREPLPAKVKINLQDPQLDWSAVNIPGIFKFTEPKSANISIEIPNVEVRVSDPQVEIANSEIYKIRDFLFRINQLPTVGWIFYLIIAWLLGEILCFLGETLIGIIFFDYKPFDLSKVERVSPCSVVSGNGNQSFRQKIKNWIYVKLCGREQQQENQENNFITVQNFIEAFSNSTIIMEISEIHFVLSRVSAGFLILILIIFVVIDTDIQKNWCYSFLIFVGSLILLLIMVYGTLFFFLRGYIWKFFTVLILFSLILLLLSFKKNLLIVGGVLLFLFFISTIFYRAHANRLLKAASRGQNGEAPRRAGSGRFREEDGMQNPATSEGN